jgi:hypothetical protein
MAISMSSRLDTEVYTELCPTKTREAILKIGFA